jgi:hypothetical protein
MKKVLLFTVVLAGLGFTSCSKDDCECTQDGITITFEEADAEELGVEGNFKDACEASEYCKLV